MPAAIQRAVTASFASATATFGSACTIGNATVAMVWVQSSARSTTVVDNAGNALTEVASITNGSESWRWYIRANIANASTTITVTSDLGTGLTIYAYEVPLLSGAIDFVSSSYAATPESPATSHTIPCTTAYDDEFVLGSSTNASGITRTHTGTGVTTAQADATPNAQWAYDRDTAAAGSNALSFDISSTNLSITAACVSFRSSGSSGPNLMGRRISVRA